MDNYEKMKKLYDEIDKLLKDPLMTKSPDFKAWKTSCLRVISKQFGEESKEYRNFKKIYYSPLALYGQNDDYYGWYQKGLQNAKKILDDYLEDMGEFDKKVSESFMISKEKKVFIVHGHDEVIKEQTARVLGQQDIKPIILHEQISTSKTIIEKIEHYGKEAGAAIILLTPDDLGKSKTESELKGRARQNVILEAGYFMGLLGRNHVIFIYTDSSMELPSDLQGILYINSDWKLSMLKELKAMGFKIDLNRL